MLIDFSFSNVFSIAFLGILTYQCFLSFFRYSLNQNKEYQYYTLYLFILLINFAVNFYFWLKPDFTNYIVNFIRLLFGYPINILIQIIYLFFLREYLHTKEVNPTLHLQLKRLIFANCILDIVSVIYWIINPPIAYWADIILNLINFILFCIPLFLVIKSKILYYKFIVIGTLCLGIGLVANLILSMLKYWHFDYDITIMMGVLIEIIVFNYALQLKTEDQSKALLVAKIEKQKAIEDEHKRMSADLHDEVGSTLSSIQIMSVISRKKMDIDMAETKKLLQIIGEQSQKMQHNLSDIVWGLRTDLNSIDDMIAKIEEIISYTLTPSQIDCTIDMENNISGITLSVLERRNILLIVKESLNNILKYANTKKVQIQFKKENQFLSFLIRDYGKGFDYLDSNKKGNGLNNMKNRADQINAIIQINSSSENGTCISIKLPTNQSH